MIEDTATKWFDVIVDVPTQEEWDEGHVERATLVENLALFGTSNQGIGAPEQLTGCDYCNVVIYCSTGGRTAQALQVLFNPGFVGYL